MRLIDSDALKRYIPTRMDMQDLYLPVHFKTLIDEQPTVEASPLVHARWYMCSYDEAICTHCGYDRLTEFECTSEAKERWGELPKFCENCGAKMDGADVERRNE